jgi:hypothetical protein
MTEGVRLDLAGMLYYNRTEHRWFHPPLESAHGTMTEHPHHGPHRHDGPRRVEPVSVSPSILRMSAVERLIAVAVVIAALWVAVRWAVS